MLLAGVESHNLLLQETYAYAKTLLDVATSSADGRARALLVGGGIANFTDVAATFKGIIQVRPIAPASFHSVHPGCTCHIVQESCLPRCLRRLVCPFRLIDSLRESPWLRAIEGISCKH